MSTEPVRGKAAPVRHFAKLEIKINVKKILLIAALLIVLSLIGAAVFLAAFDLDRYRPALVRNLEQVLEKPVTVEKMALGWRAGLALTLHGLVIYSDGAKKQELLRLKSAGALMNPLALLDKRLEISSIFLTEPRIFLSRNAEGKILGFEIKPKKKMNASVFPLLAAASLRIEKVKLESGEIIFQDESRRPPLELRLADIEAVLKNVAWNSPVQVKAEASFLSPQRNLNLEGEVKMTPRGPVAENVRLDLDVNSIHWEQAEQTLPFLRETKLQKGTKGKLLLLVPGLPLSKEGLENINAQVQFNDGQIALANWDVPVERINASARVVGGRFEVDDFSAFINGSPIQAKAAYDKNLPYPSASIQAQAERIALDKIHPSVSSKPRLEGLAAAAFQGTIQAEKTTFLKNTLAGKGTLHLDEPVIRNFNFLNEVFSRMGIIPGLAGKLKERLPANYQERLSARDTVLNPIRLAFIVDQGTAVFQNFSIAADSFQIAGMGQVNPFDQTVFLQTLLYVEKDLSEAIIRSVNELEYLADNQGRLQIPLIIKGTFQDLSIRPELQYIASRLAVSKATEAVSEWLLKKKTDGQNSQEPASPSSGQKLLGDLLQSALRSRGGGSQEK